MFSFLIFHMHATCVVHFILDLFALAILGEQYTLRSSSLCNFLLSFVNLPIWSPRILLIALLSDSLNLCFQTF